MIILKNKNEIEEMRYASKVVVEVLQSLKEESAPGVSTWDLDMIAEDLTLRRGAKPAFKGYRNFPASICCAINNEVVHGIPSKKKILHEGDILSIDFGVYKNGFYGDSAITIPVGNVSLEAQSLLEVTKNSLYIGIEKAIPSNRLYDISHAIQNYVEEAGFSIVRSFVGHGIGRKLHEDPQVPNFVPTNGNYRWKGIRLKPGMVLAIEPMVNIGNPDIKILNDGWTAITEDGKLSAHFEHTVAITENDSLILTDWEI
ncbi:MAG: type I methionyl aminopeptidase [Thermodesulfobacteriota bacterium]